MIFVVVVDESRGLRVVVTSIISSKWWRTEYIYWIL